MFKDYDVVCFFGDSITANGLWLSEIYQYLRKKYKIKCYNCGVSGGMTVRAKEFLHANCLIFNPDVVVTMFGINDIARWYYSSTCKDPNKQALLDEAFEEHKIGYEQIIKDIIASGARPVICLPPPYDEISDSPEENLRCQARMREAMAFQTELAKKYDCVIVDMCDALSPYLALGTAIEPDRVHPTPFGHHIMAQYFLNAVKEKNGLDISTPFEFEEWNLKRRQAEQQYKSIEYVEFCDIFDLGWKLNKTNEEKKHIVQERLDKRADKDDYISRAYKLYIDKIDIRDRLIGEMVKLTIF